MQLKNHKKFKQIEKFLNTSDFQRLDDNSILIRNKFNKIVKSTTIISLALANFCLLLWFIFPVVENQYKFPQPIYIPFDYIPYYNYVYLTVCVCFYYSSMVIIVGTCILCSYMPFLSGEYLILSNFIQDSIVEIREDEKIEIFYNKIHQNLKKVVIQHELISKHGEIYKSIVYIPFLIQLSFTGLLLCFIGYQITLVNSFLSVRFVAMCQFTVFNLLEMFIYCYWGEELRANSLKLTDSLYNSKWYCIPYNEQLSSKYRSIKLTILFILMRGQRPLTIKGGTLNLSLDTYMNIIKMSYSFLTLLLNQK